MVCQCEALSFSAPEWSGSPRRLHLQRRGWSVTLVDRKEPGRETSYGNAGIIQSEGRHGPIRCRAIFATLVGDRDRPHQRCALQLASLPRHVGPLLRYWWHSAPERHRRISQSYASIIAQAAGEHDVLIREAGADNHRAAPRLSRASTAHRPRSIARHWSPRRWRPNTACSRRSSVRRSWRRSSPDSTRQVRARSTGSIPGRSRTRAGW